MGTQVSLVLLSVRKMQFGSFQLKEVENVYNVNLKSKQRMLVLTMTGLQHLHTKRPSPQELPSELVQSQAQLKRKHLIHYVDLYFTVNTVVPATQSGHQL